MDRLRYLHRGALLSILLLALAGCGPLPSQGEVDSPETTIATQALASDIARESVAQPAWLPAESETTPAAPVQQSPTSAVVAQATDIESRLVELYQRANPAVVYIVVPGLGSGSGFVYNDEGHIVTNAHVVSSGQRYEVVFASGERRAATLVGEDQDSDLAVLHVESLPEGVVPLPLAEAASIQVGQFVVAIGNPFGEQGSMSLGIVSGVGRSLPSQRSQGMGSTYSLPQVIQTDAPINPGNSGGPLLNLQGEVVGVNAAIASTTGTNSGVGFSIPVEAIRTVVPNLIAEGKHVYGYMGAGFDNELSLDEQRTFGLSQTDGAYILNITPGSPAEQAGLVAADPQTGRGGDLIIAIDDTPIRSFADLNSTLVFHADAGQTITLTLLRDGQTITLPITLGARP